MWIDDDPREVALVVRGQDLLEYPDLPVNFGPVKSSTHMLGTHGWVLRMRQRTPIHVEKTRPSISLCPFDSQNFGFRYKIRARRPYLNAYEVFEDLGNARPFRFSLTKFEIKEVPVIIADENLKKELENAKSEVESLRKELQGANWLNREMMKDDETDLQGVYSQVEKLLLDNQNLRDKLETYESDPFLALKTWTDQRVSGLELKKRVHRDVPDNVIDLVEAIRVRDRVDSGLEEKINNALMG